MCTTVRIPLNAGYLFTFTLERPAASETPTNPLPSSVAQGAVPVHATPSVQPRSDRKLGTSLALTLVPAADAGGPERGGLALDVPRDSLWEVLLDVIGEIAECLVEGLDPFDLIGVPMICVSRPLLLIPSFYCYYRSVNISYLSLNSFNTRLPKNCADPSDSSTCLNGRLSTVTQASTMMPSATALSCEPYITADRKLHEVVA